jgi:hypothetical protein
MELRSVVRSIVNKGHYAVTGCGLAALVLLGACAAGQNGAQPDDDAAWQTATGEGSATLVRGRITADTLVVEPLLTLRNVSVTSPMDGQHRFLGFGVGGDTVVDVRFDAEPVVAGGGSSDERHFSFAVDTRGGEDLEAVEIHLADGRSLRRHARLSPRDMLDALTAPGAITAERSTPERVTVRWDAAQFPAVVILDASTSRILSFGRGGEIEVTTYAEAIDVVVSEGVHSMTRRFRVPR